MKRKLQSILSPLLALVLTGCMAQSSVQGKYMAVQKQCRAEAEATLPVPASGAIDNVSADITASLARQFSDCMNRSGWKVAGPKPTGTTVAQNPPTGILPSAPPALAASVAPPAAAATQQQPQPARTAAPLPSLPPTNAQPAPATYQPGRPVGVESGSDYGTGAGRQF